jgi:hypothetical protein
MIVNIFPMNDELNNLIQNLSEENFRKLIREYCKEKYKTPNVRIVDGPYDGGNDLEIIIGEKEVRKNIQITSQKEGIEDKITRDLKKSKANVTKYQYLNSLDFYISKNLSKEKRNEYELNAEINYGIQLKIIDANILSQEATNYPSIRNFTLQSHNISIVPTTTQIADKQSKILFDVLTLDKNSIEIKRNFISSYIFSFLYTEPESNIDQIYEFINPHLNNSLDKEFLEKELNYLRSKKHLMSGATKNKYRLSDEKNKEIGVIYSSVSSEEQSLIEMVRKFISDNHITCQSSELVGMLYKLYQENYTIDIEEIKSTGDSFGASMKRSYNDLIYFFIKRGIKNEVAKELSKTLLEQCDNSKFLNKLASIHLFNNLYSSDKLEKYINNKIQKIVLDTQILIRIICVLSDKRIEFSDSALQSVKILLSTFNKFKTRIKLFSTYDYVEEVAAHLLEAMKIQRFIKLPFFSKLGKSNNLFCNLYLELKRKDLIDEDEDFTEFVAAIIDEEILEKNDEQFIRTATNKIAKILELAEIELIYHPNYTNYSILRREYEISLAHESRERSYLAIENDLRTILYLATKENHVNPENGELNEPFLVTWDYAFYPFLKQLLERHKEFTYWYIYSPLKIVDRFSVMNFNLNPKSINQNIIALTESNFNYSTKTSSFLDVVSSFFNKSDVSDLNLINKLIRLKEEARHLEEVPLAEELPKERESNSLTRLLINLRNHYHSTDAKYKFNDVIQVFELPKFENDIIAIFHNTIVSFKTDLDLKVMYNSFDTLIAENKK